jgi:hypothetical protein
MAKKEIGFLRANLSVEVLVLMLLLMLMDGSP